MIVHIGTHKTGTTSIQETLQSNRDKLAKQGILYPRTDREPWPNLPKHTSVYSAIRKGDENILESERRALLDEFKESGCSTIIISEEGLSEPNQNSIDFFKYFQNSFDIDVICYLRRQDYFIESLYNQFVRERGRKESRSILMFKDGLDVKKRLDYFSILNEWKTISSHVRALDFDKEVKEHGLLNSFFNNLGISGLELTDSLKNPSPDMRLILTIARLNRYGINFDLSRISRASKRIENSGMFVKKKYILGKKERIKIIEEWCEINEKLSESYRINFTESLPNDEDGLASEDPSWEYCLALMGELSRIK